MEYCYYRQCFDTKQCFEASHFKQMTTTKNEAAIRTHTQQKPNCERKMALSRKEEMSERDSLTQCIFVINIVIAIVLLQFSMWIVCDNQLTNLNCMNCVLLVISIAERIIRIGRALVDRRLIRHSVEPANYCTTIKQNGKKTRMNEDIKRNTRYNFFILMKSHRRRAPPGDDRNLCILALMTKSIWLWQSYWNVYQRPASNHPT